MAQRIRTLLATLALLLPMLASAQLANVTTESNLRSGPSEDYPLVAILGPNVQVSVQACVEDYTWCDVLVGDNPSMQGWVYAGNLVYPYQSTRLPIITYGLQIGLAVEAFNIEEYWDRHYRDRPWYPSRGQYPQHPQRFGNPDLRHPQPNRGTYEKGRLTMPLGVEPGQAVQQDKQSSDEKGRVITPMGIERGQAAQQSHQSEQPQQQPPFRSEREARSEPMEKAPGQAIQPSPQATLPQQQQQFQSERAVRKEPVSRAPAQAVQPNPLAAQPQQQLFQGERQSNGEHAREVEPYNNRHCGNEPCKD